MLEYNENTNSYDLSDDGYNIMQSMSFSDIIDNMTEELEGLEYAD